MIFSMFWQQAFEYDINGKEMIALTKLTTPKRGPSIKFMLVN